MAKNHENMDQIFREKLENHQEKPSQLAWERLENQLPEKKKSNSPIYWWAAAAVLLILFSVGTRFWPNDGEIPEENLVAESLKPELVDTEQNQELIETPSEIQEADTNTPTIEKEEETQSKPTIVTPKKQEAQKVIKQEEFKAPQNLIAQNETPIEESVKEEKKATIEPLIAEKEIPEMKTLDINQAVAELDTKTEEEPTYKVTIYSNGIKEDKNLIADIGKKVNQVEGLLGKVDEGFANLQDAKNNLFTNLTTKKEKVTEED